MEKIKLGALDEVAPSIHALQTRMPTRTPRAPISSPHPLFFNVTYLFSYKIDLTMPAPPLPNSIPSHRAPRSSVCRRIFRGHAACRCTRAWPRSARAPYATSSTARAGAAPCAHVALPAARVSSASATSSALCAEYRRRRTRRRIRSAHGAVV
jgi:hypothetical protein